MARRTKMSTLVVDNQAQILADLLDNGFLDFFDGAQPSKPEEKVTSQQLLGSIRFDSPGFTQPVDGTIYALPATDGIVIASGTAAWARAFQSDHKTAVMDVSVGTRDANVIVETVDFTRGAVIGLIAFEHEVAKETPGL
jgi:hypothetical protein